MGEIEQRGCVETVSSPTTVLAGKANWRALLSSQLGHNQPFIASQHLGLLTRRRIVSAGGSIVVGAVKWKTKATFAPDVARKATHWTSAPGHVQQDPVAMQQADSGLEPGGRPDPTA